ncbi:hypothetical protein ANANG_G00181590 [Anguilla anguilla]|uniref:C2 domain-containing protein n=1 Tax=Anguilla anguilla TaxID=7936 RepID=A0A9D3M8M8_ANGAN|nr:hypothetical protein ANANG_G00181590 [Anguilla anguilla]
MAEITNIRPTYEVSPVLAGFLGAGLTGSYKLRGDRVDPATDPPYKFIHMLKGISIYPETLSNTKKIVRVGRRGRGAGRAGPRVGRAWAGPGAAAARCCWWTRPGAPRRTPTPRPRPPRAGEPAGEGAAHQVRLLLPGQQLGQQQRGQQQDRLPLHPRRRPGLGALSLAVDYNFPKKALVVTILEARGLPAVDEESGSSDPYVKMTVLPEKKHRVKTRVLRKTLEPVFDETFTFYGVPYSALPELVLHFLVLSFDRFSRDDVIGEAVVPLAGVDPSTGRVQLTQRICKRSIQAGAVHGTCFSPVPERISTATPDPDRRLQPPCPPSDPIPGLSVVVLKAKHLPKMDITGLSGNPYVKVNVFYGRKRIAKKKTHVKKCTLNPVFNESFIYDVPAELMPDVSVEFLVIDFDRTTKNEVVGRVVLGAHSPSSSGATHWREVLDNPRRQIAKWHNLAEY